MTLSHRQPEIQDRQGALSIHHATPDAQLAPLTSQRETTRGGFTLIETALALLAIGMGLLAIFGLGRIGLQSTKESENDTRCVQLADAVFETLREYNTRYVAYAQSNHIENAWAMLWDQTITQVDSIPFPPVANMSTNANLWLQIDTSAVISMDNSVRAFNKDAISLTDWNPRYQLIMAPPPGAFSPIAGGYNLLFVMLYIYPDGDTYSSDYRTFQTTLTNPGGLP